MYKVNVRADKNILFIKCTCLSKEGSIYYLLLERKILPSFEKQVKTRLVLVCPTYQAIPFLRKRYNFDFRDEVASEVDVPSALAFYWYSGKPEKKAFRKPFRDTHRVGACDWYN